MSSEFSSESPDPKGVFHFATRIAWHVCGCGKERLGELFKKTDNLLGDIAQGKATMCESPAESRPKLQAIYEEELRKRRDESSPSFLAFIEDLLRGTNLETSHQRSMAIERQYAAFILKSQLRGMPDEWLKDWGLEEFR
jgi:hypothetical protein